MLKPVSKDKSKESSSHSFYDINLKKVDKDEKSNDNGGPQWGKLKHVVIEEKPKVEEVEEGVEEETPEAEEPKISAAEKSPPRSPLRSPTGLQAGPGLNEQTADASSVEIDRLTSELKAATDKATNLTGALQESEDKRVACCAHEAFLADRLKDAERRIIDLQGSRCDRAQCVESIEQLRQKLLDAERQLAEQQGQDGVTDGDEESASREEVALLHTIVQSKDTEVESLSKQLKELKAMSQLSLIKATEQITSLEHANSQHVSLRAKVSILLQFNSTALLIPQYLITLLLFYYFNTPLPYYPTPVLIPYYPTPTLIHKYPTPTLIPYSPTTLLLNGNTLLSYTILFEYPFYYTCSNTLLSSHCPTTLQLLCH